MTGPICITQLPCGPRLRRKGFYACLAWLAWQMHRGLSTTANTLVCTCKRAYPSWPFNSHMFSIQGALQWKYGRPPWAVKCISKEPHHHLTLKINVLLNNWVCVLSPKSNQSKLFAWGNIWWFNCHSSLWWLEQQLQEKQSICREVVRVDRNVSKTWNVSYFKPVCVCYFKLLQLL